MTPDESHQLVALLVQQTYVRETDGPNDSPEIRHYQASTGNAPPDPWCCSFVCWGLHYLLGNRMTLPMTGSCELLRQAAKKRGMLIGVPRYGCVGLLINRDTNTAHHAFVVTSDPEPDGSFDTIEGNTNDNGSREGDGVYERHRGGAADHLTYEFIAPEGI